MNKIKTVIAIILISTVLVLSFNYTNAKEKEEEPELKETLNGEKAQVDVSKYSFSLYKLLSLFDSDIKCDMDSINWDINNSDEDKVLLSKKVSFYKGVPVVKVNWLRSGSFLILFLGPNDDISALHHEYGHTLQQYFLGPIPYLLFIGIPSYFELSDNEYYSRPWELTADIFGGVTSFDRVQEGYKNISNNEYYEGGLYLIVGTITSIVLSKLFNEIKTKIE